MNQQLADYFPLDQFGEILDQQTTPYGMSGAIVRSVTTQRGNYILRIFHGDQTTWEHSLAAQRLAAEHGIAPSLLHVDEARHATVSQKITALPFAAALAQPAMQQAVLASLTAQLATLHALPAAGLVINHPLVFARTVWTSQYMRPGFPAWATPLATRLAAIETVLARDDRLVLSHGDLNPTNILWDGTRVWLVDWDGAGMCHPYMDLATLANFLGLPDTPALGLLAMQEQVPVKMDQQITFKACRDLARIAYGSVFMELVPDLTRITFASLDETATLSQCFARVTTGELNLADDEARGLIGAAFYRQCMESM